MKRFRILPLILFVIVFEACSTVPLTGRRQLNIANSAAIQQEAAAAYQQFLRDPSTRVVTSGTDYQRVKNVGNRVARAIEK